jgi:hypothetical protein
VPKGEPVPESAPFECLCCGEETTHERKLSMPARYLGEKNLSPRISGGRFDTTGHAAPPVYPDMPGESEYQARVDKAVRALGPNASDAAIRSEVRALAGDAPSLSDYAAHLSRPECREIKRERQRVAKQNAQKRKRLAAAKRGENVNFRRDRCAGDPKLN